MIGLDGATAADHQARFDAMLASPLRVVIGHSVFMLLVVIVVSRGVNDGLEKAARVLMPALFILMIGLAVYASATGDFARAVEFAQVNSLPSAEQQFAVRERHGHARGHDVVDRVERPRGRQQLGH